MYIPSEAQPHSPTSGWAAPPSHHAAHTESTSLERRQSPVGHAAAKGDFVKEAKRAATTWFQRHDAPKALVHSLRWAKCPCTTTAEDNDDDITVHDDAALYPLRALCRSTGHVRPRQTSGRGS